MGISGSQPAYTSALGGVMRGSSSRANVHSKQTFVAIAGVQYAAARAVATERVLNETLSITETDGETPNTATFDVKGFQPQDGQEVVITQGSINNLHREFAGTLLIDTSGYVGTPANARDTINAIDYTWQLTRRTITKRWTNVSATVIAREIVARAPGFTSRRVEEGLAIVDEFTVTNQTLVSALDHLARRIGATWKPTYHKDVRFGLTLGSETNPTTMTVASALLTDMSAFKVRRDLSQVITQQPVEGMGSTTTSTVVLGATAIAVTDVAPFSATGGLIVSGPQVIAYTGISTGSTTVQGGTSTVAGGSSDVVARPAPVTAPTVANGAASGGAGGPGNFQWKVSFIYSDGSQSLPGPASATLATDGLHKFDFTGIPVGDARVTARRLFYATAAGTPDWTNSAQVVTQQTINDNTTTAVTFDPGTTSVQSSADPLTFPANYAGGSTYVYVADTAPFSASGGSLVVAGEAITYTGRSAASGIGALTGIPASGTGAITFAVFVGDQISAGAIPGSTTLAVAETSAFVAAGGLVTVAGQSVLYTGRSVSSGPGTLTGVTGIAFPIDVGEDVTMTYAAGSVTLPIVDTVAFSATGGTARIGSQTFTYTGRSAASGPGTLTGIPASGPGALATDTTGGSTILAGAGGNGALVGIPSTGAGSVVLAINEGDDVNLRVVIDDLPAQAAIAALIGGGDDGIIEGDVIQDGRISETEARARGRAQLDLRKTIDVAVTCTSHDRNLRASRELGVNLTQPNVVGTFRLRQVTISNYLPARWPTRQVSASSTRFTLEDLLRLARTSANG